MTNRTITLEITGMHCASCGILVDDCMEDVEGLISSRTDLKSGRCVTVVADSVADSAVLAAVEEAGYTGVILESVATS